jgi:hypothetical protein
MGQDTIDMELEVLVMDGHQIPVIFVVETIQYRSPGITVIALQDVFVEIEAFFVPYLIAIHAAPPVRDP